MLLLLVEGFHLYLLDHTGVHFIALRCLRHDVVVPVSGDRGHILDNLFELGDGRHLRVAGFPSHMPLAVLNVLFLLLLKSSQISYNFFRIDFPVSTHKSGLNGVLSTTRGNLVRPLVDIHLVYHGA